MSKFRCFDTYNLTSATGSDNTKRLKRQTIFTETQTVAIGNASYQLGNDTGNITPGYKKKKDGSIYYGNVYVKPQDEQKNNGCLIGAKNFESLYDVLFGAQQATALETVDEHNLALSGSTWEGNAMSIKFQSIGEIGPAIINTPDGSANYMTYPARQDFLPVQHDACGNPPTNFPGIIIDPCYNIFYPRCGGKRGDNNYLKNIHYNFNEFQITNPEFINYLSHTSTQALRQFPYTLNYQSTTCNPYRSEFIFTFYNLNGETNLAKFLPISNKQNSLFFGTIKYETDPLDDKITTITIPFKFINNGSPTDGLTFYTLTNTLTDFYNATGQPVIINQFGGIPLARDGKQFQNINGLAFSLPPGDAPLVLPSTSFESTFENCTEFDYDLSLWDTTGVTSMKAMFKNTPFNQPLQTWNTSNVTDMSSMFENNYYFNQQISYDPVNNYWNTSNVLSLVSMFQNAVEFNNGYAGKLSPNPDIDHPLNWLLNENVTLLYVRTNANNLTNQNAYPLSANYIFAYTFYNTIGATDADICNNLPLYVTDSTYTWGKTIDGSLIDVTVIFNTINGYRPDGITFFDPSGSKVAFYNSTNMPVHMYFLNATPLARLHGFQFANLNMLDLSSISPPEIFPDTSFNAIFCGTNILPHSNLNEWPVHEVTSMLSAFQDSSFSEDLTKWNTSKVTDMTSMFQNCTFNGQINTWNTSNVTTMASMFQNNQTFNQQISYDVSNNDWNTAKVINMTNIFNNATSFNNGYDPSDISHPLNWSLDACLNRTDAITNALSLTYENGKPLTSDIIGKFVYHFYNVDNTSHEDICANYLPFDTSDNCLKINPPVITTSIDTSGLTMTTVTVYFGFDDNGTTNDGIRFTSTVSDYYNSTGRPFIITSFQEMPLSRAGSQFYNLNYLEIHTDMPTILTNTSLDNCFYNCYRYNSYIGNWDITNAISMAGIFSGCHAFNQDISLWNTSNITDMSGVFYDCTSFDQDINTWDTSNVTNMSYMFYNCISFSGYLSNWNTANVTNMSYMFYGCEYFNQDIGSFITSSVTDMSHMFEGCYAFDRSLSSWDMFNVTNMNSMFKGCATFNRNVSFNPLTGAWITCNVLDMTSVFEGCTSFNNGYPIGDIDHPLSWHLEGATILSNSTTNTPILSMQNAFPLSAAYRGKFVYSFYNAAGIPDASISQYVPFITADDNLKYNPISIASDPSDATLKTIYIFYGYKATANPTTNDGLSFYDPSVNSFYNSTNQPVTIVEFQNLPLSRAGSQFRDLSGIVISALDNPSMLPNTSLANCFNNCVNFNSSEIKHWNLRNATNMSSMFANAKSFNQSLTYSSSLPDEWDTSAVTNMTSIFEGATSFNNGYPAGNMDSCLNWLLNPSGAYSDPLVSSNLTFETAFPLSNCPSGTFIFKFYNDASYSTNDIINNLPIKRTSGRLVLTSTPTVSYIMDTSGRLTTVTVPYQFTDTNSTDPSKNSDGLYLYDNSFAQLVSTKEFFITQFGKIPLSRLGNQLANVKKLVIQSYQGAGTPSLVYMTLNGTFQSSTYFNSYIGDWNTKYINSMASTFNSASSFNNGNYSGLSPLLWNTSRVTNMNGMFYGASNFNQCISHSASSTAMFSLGPTQMGTFSYSIYSSYFGGTDANPNLSWFDGRTPISTGTTSNLSTLETATNNYSTTYLATSVKWTKNFTAPSTGTYTFYLDSDDGAFLTVDGTIIIYNGGEHGVQRRTGSIYMLSGQTYVMNIYFGNSGGPYGFSFGGYAIVPSSDTNDYWNTRNVTNMQSMFDQVGSFNNGDPANAGLRPLKIHTNSVTTLAFMFRGWNTSFNQNISHDPSGDYWNTSNVTNMNWFLARNNFNNGDPTNSGTKPLKLFTNSLVSIGTMFQENGAFNQTIGHDASGYWDTRNVTSFRQFFWSAARFNNGDPTNAGTKPLRLFTNSANDLRAAFYGTPFNQTICHDPSNGYWNTSNVSNMTIVFYGCGNYNNGDISNAGTKPLNLYTNNVTDFSSMFELAQSFNQQIGHDPSNDYWNTGKANKFVAMFKQAYKFNNGDITDAGTKPLKFNTSACWDVQSMFWNASAFNQTICHDPSNNYWDTSAVQNMVFLFNQATKFNNGDISNAGTKPLKLYTNSCKTMYITFASAPAFNQTIGHDASGYWNTSSVTSFQSMFSGAQSFNNGDISNACSKPLNFYTNIATRTDGMFGSNYSFNQTIGHDPSNGYWNTSNVTLMFNMFNGASIFNNGDLSNAGTKPLKLHTNASTTINSIFNNAYAYNQYTSHDPSNGYWNTSIVTDMSCMFYNATLFNNGDISNAGSKPLKLYTNKVLTILGGFSNAINFNQYISHDPSNGYWDTSSCVQHREMFSGAILFNNGDISNAGTKPLKLYMNSNTGTLISMFYNATSFNQMIGHDASGYWNTRVVYGMASMFEGATLFNNGDISNAGTKPLKLFTNAITGASSSSSMQYMFKNAPSFNQTIGHDPSNGYWDTSACTDMTAMFSGTSLFNNGDISNAGSKPLKLYVNNVTTMSDMFSYANNFNQYISHNSALNGYWNTSNVTTFQAFLYNSNIFNNGDISNAMSKPLNLYTNKATNLQSTFESASNFNQTIGYNASGYWDTSSVTTMRNMFHAAVLFNNGDPTGQPSGTKPLKLDTRRTTDMYYMFRHAQGFNQNISYNPAVPNAWNTSLVTNMDSVLRFAMTFNNGYPAGNSDNCLNWILSSTGSYVEATLATYLLTFTNGFPLTNTRYGTFNFKFYNTPNYSTTDISKNLPIKKTNGRMTTSAPTITSSGTLVTVSVPYKFVDTQVPATIDGLYLYDNSLAQATNANDFIITQFDGIQLSRVGQQFRNVKRLIIDPAAGTPGLAYCSLSGGFMDATSFNSYIGDWNTSTVTAMNSTFENATSFNNSDPSNIGTKPLLWNTSKVTTMANMFKSASTYNQYMSHDPSNGYWNTNIVTNMSSMFNNTPIFNNGDISNAGSKPLKLYTNKATNLQFMFLSSTNFNQTIGHDASGYWDTSAATTFQGMFWTTLFNNGDISNAGSKPLKLYSHNVTTLDSMFSGANKFNQTIGHDPSNGYWNTSNVTNMFCMFNLSSIYNNGDISNAGTKPLKFYTNKLTNLLSAFGGASNFNQTIGHDPSNGYWDTSACTDMSQMFQAASLFNNGDISNAGTKPLNLYTHNVTTMQYMFNEAPNFNQTIGHNLATNYWNTSKVTSFYRFLLRANIFNNGDISNAGLKPLNLYTNKATTLESMFGDMYYFNQTIGYNASGYWDTSAVTNMSYMFHIARVFNNGDPTRQPLGTKPLKLDTRKTTDLYWMFRGAYGFNQNISYNPTVPNAWNTTLVTNMDSVLYNTTSFNNGYPAGNMDNCLNWILSTTGSYTDATTVANSLTLTNGFPLISSREGTFIFKFYNDLGYSNTTITSYIPIKKTNGRMSTSTPTITSTTNPSGTLVTVSVPYKFVDTQVPATVDGLYLYDCSLAQLTPTKDFIITQFDGIQLSRVGQQFRNVKRLVIDPSAGTPGLAYCSLSGGFMDASNFNSYIGDWNTSTVTAMNSTFANAKSFNNSDPSNIGTKPLLWNTGKVTTMESMFNNATAYNQYMSHDPSNGYWNTSNVTSMYQMLFTASSYNNGDISNAGSKPLNLYTHNVTTMYAMFSNSMNFNQTIGHDTSNGYWDTSKVTIFSYLLNTCTKFNNGDISNAMTKPLNLYTNKVTNLYSTFAQTWVFNQTIGYNASGYWDTSAVTNMSYMLYQTYVFNNGDQTGQPGTKPLKFDTRRTTDMSYMFYQAYGFNQNISYNTTIPNAWNTSLITNMNYVLYNTTSFNNGYPAGNMDNCLNWILSISGSYVGSTTGASILTTTNGFPLTSTRTGTFIFKFYNDLSYSVADISQNLPIKKTDGRMSTSAPTITSSGTLVTVSVPYKFVDTQIPTPNDGLYLYDNSLAQLTNTKDFTITQFDGIQLSRVGQQFRNVTRLIIDPAAGTPGIAYCSLMQTFWDATYFNSYIGNWNTNTVNNMIGTFMSAEAFNNGDSSASSTKPLLWNTSKVTAMNNMFQRALVYNQYMSHDPTYNYWNTSSVNTMSLMFDQAYNFNNGDTTNAGSKPLKLYTNSVTNMDQTFQLARKFNQTIGHDVYGYWNTSNVISMYAMFNSASIFNNGDISNAGTKPLKFYTTNVTGSMYSMFGNLPVFNQYISHDPTNGYWNTSNVTNMEKMLYGMGSFNNGDTSNAGTKPLNLHTNSTLKTSGMFNSSANFNQTIGHDPSNGYWNTSNVTEMFEMFKSASIFNNGNTTNAGTKPLKLYTNKVTSISNMFLNAAYFNQTIGHDASGYWDTSLNTSMSGLFLNASRFNNGDITNIGSKPLKLYTTKVTGLPYLMFSGMSQFNQNISYDPSKQYWNMSSVTDFTRVIEFAPIFNNGYPAGDIDHPLNWIINRNASVGAGLESTGLTTENAFPLSSAKSGTFIFKFYNTPNYSNTDISKNLPIKTMDGRMILSAPTITSTTDTSGTLVSVSVPYNFLDTTFGTPNDGLYLYDNSLAQLTNTKEFFITQFGSMPLSRLGSQFRNVKRLIIDPSAGTPTLTFGTLNSAFLDATSFNSYIGNWNTRTITSLDSAFKNATSYNQYTSYDPVNGYWNTRNATSIAYMFSGATAFNNSDISNAGTKPLNLFTNKLITAIWAFQNATSFNQYISHDSSNGYWDTSGAWDIGAMFNFATLFNNGDISNAGTKPLKLYTNSNVGSLYGLFQGASNFNQTIGHDASGYWDTRLVNGIGYMFSGATLFNNGDISNAGSKPLRLFTNKLSSSPYIFQNATAFNQYISHDPSNGYWDTSAATDIGGMFQSATLFNNGDISNAGSKPLKLYMNSNTSLYGMFNSASNFNQTIGHDASGYWNTRLVTGMGAMFYGSTLFNNGDISNAGSKPLRLFTNKVTLDNLLISMFQNASNFNQTIGHDPSNGYWDTSACTSMNSMFYAASKFNNGDISNAGTKPLNLHTNSVTNISSMFQNAGEFNQYISHNPSGGYWNTGNVTTTATMFYTALKFNNGDITSNGLKPLKWFTNSLTNIANTFTAPLGNSMAFNQTISYDPSYGYWDVSKVTVFDGIFSLYSSSKFNNGYPAGNETTPLNWNLNANATYANIPPSSLSVTNGFPLTNVRSGTFSFKFYNDPNYSNVDISNNLPIKRSDGRLKITSAPTITSIVDSSGLLTTVSVPYKFVDNQYGTTTDGVYFYDNSLSKASSKPLTIIQFSGIPLSRSGSQFRGMRNFEIDPSDGIPGLTIVPLNSTFRDTSTNTYVGNWNTKYVPSMNSTFYNTYLFNNSDTTNAGTKPLLWNTDRVTDMQYMFYNTKAFNQTMSHNPSGSYINTSKVTNMSSMFQNSLIFNNGDTTNAGSKPLKLYTNAVTNATNMFYNAPAFNQTVGYDASGYWDTSSTSLFESMFARASTFNNGNTTNAGTKPLLLKTNAATNMDSMFYNTPAFNQYISHDASNGYWNTSNLTTMNQMFKNTTIFNNGNVTDAGTNPLKLYTNNVTDMGLLFGDATVFNQTIGHDASGYWNTSNATNMSSMFFNSLLYNNGDITGSGTKPLKLYTNKTTLIDNMFNSAITFNQTIGYDASGYWDTSAATTFNSMFNGATSFNNGQTSSSGTGTIPLKLKTSKGTNLYSMFYNATGFNQNVSYDLSNQLWDTSAVTTMENVFRNATIFNNSEDTGGTTSQLNWLLAPGVNTTNATTGSNLSSTNKIPLP